MSDDEQEYGAIRPSAAAHSAVRAGETDSDGCPVCGSEPGQVSHQLATDQEACTADDCPIIAWDRSVAGGVASDE